jgi:hypothetical protein
MYDCMRSESESELDNQLSGILSLYCLFTVSVSLPVHNVTLKNTHKHTHVHVHVRVLVLLR